LLMTSRSVSSSNTRAFSRDTSELASFCSASRQ
jgi:hypothetical protein